MGLASELLASRRSANLTAGELAKNAKVSNRTILLLEREASLAEEARNATNNPRKQRALARSLTKLAGALGKDPRPWLDQWRALVQGGSDTPFFADARVRTGGVATASARALVGSTYDWFCKHSPETAIRTRVGILDEGGSGSNARTRFYEEFAEAVFKKLGCRVPPDPQRCTNLNEVYDYLQDTDEGRRVHLAIGISKTVARRRNRVEFIPIPGIRFRLACLVMRNRAHDAKISGDVLSWQAVLDWPRKSDPKLFLHILGIRDEIASTYLNDECGYDHVSGSQCQFEQLNELDVHAIASRLLECFKLEKESPKVRTVFVCGEEYVDAVKKAVNDKNIGSKKLAFNWVDLAANDKRLVPEFKEAMVTRADDDRWKQLIVDSVSECFVNSAYQMAEVYANYFSTMIQQNAKEVEACLDGEDPWPTRYVLWEDSITKNFVTDFKPVFAEKLKQFLPTTKIGAAERIVAKVVPWHQAGEGQK
jgi:hypothetical protein